MSSLPIFLCGPHCSGKTSIIKDLFKDNLTDEVGLEIGKELFYRHHLVTATQGAEFEIDVTQKEIQRDIEYLKKNCTIGIESWHPGNLAYAKVRNPEIVSILIQEMKKSPLLNIAVGICFEVSWENIFLRTRTFKDDKVWAANFYAKIGSYLRECITALGLSQRCVFINANRPYEEVYSDVKSVIKEFK